MVSNSMDMLGEDDAKPENDSISRLVEEIANNGEAIVTFDDGRTVEFHGDDTYFYHSKDVIFTETETPDGDEAESWFDASKIVSVQRH